MIDDKLRTRMLTSSALSTKVGGTRIFPLIKPQGIIADSVVSQRISAVRDIYHGGITGLVQSRFQFTCISATPDGAKALAADVVAILHGWTDRVASPRVFYCRVDNQIDLYEEGTDESAVAVDVIVQHEEG